MKNNIVAFFSLLMRRKMLLKRSVGEMPREMTSSAVFVLGVSASIGISVFDMYPIMKAYGGPSIISFPFAGIFQSVAVLCYCEMASIKPCMGGPYHYAYQMLSEFEAFLIGWVLMLCLLAGVSYRLKYISSLLDVIFFDGNLSSREKSAMPLPSNFYFLSEFPDLLALIISFTLAGLLSLGESESARYILACFCACLMYLTILILTSVGFGDYTVFQTLQIGRLDVLLDSYLPCSQDYVYIFLLSFLGEETVAANETLPATMLRLYICCLLWNTIYPVLMLLNFQREDDELNSVRRLLERYDLSGLHVLVLYGVIGGSLCSVFLLMMSLERLILSMSRDGLLFKLFVNVAHSSDTYVAPSFFIGLLSGFLAVFFNLKILREVFVSTNMIAAILGPLFVLKSRYLWSIDYVWLYANRERPEPGILTNVVVTILGLSVAAVGYFLCLSIRHVKNYGDLVVTKFPMTYIIVIILFSFVALCTFITLLFLPQNPIVSKYKIWGVPFTPIFSIFLHAATGPLIVTEAYSILTGWVILGLFVYFFYSITNSQEDI
ncbi:hypothetical protein GE061_015056 [Apolygus lucorum]|uniref:Cationic amino acid transporter C-terminal domain-containing protein n=1 Tax=Apolygus lucorum TaxID=248454 RepID=A0A8S9XL17_APOLU|nr:hypothetical protein GE061_015056 [Apolygus lucorum]